MENLVVYSMSPAPISYIGELVSNDDSSLILKRVLVLYQQHNKGGDSEAISIGNVPFATRDSTITISKKICPGVLIEGVDDELQNHYRKEIIAAYSRLKIIA